MLAGRTRFSGLSRYTQYIICAACLFERDLRLSHLAFGLFFGAIYRPRKLLEAIIFGEIRRNSYVFDAKHLYPHLPFVSRRFMWPFSAFPFFFIPFSPTERPQKKGLPIILGLNIRMEHNQKQTRSVIWLLVSLLMHF